jgi:hypothetical protein
MTVANPAIPSGCDLRIVGELDRVRQVREQLGELPAFRRGQMYFDFDLGKVRIGPAKGGAA